MKRRTERIVLIVLVGAIVAVGIKLAIFLPAYIASNPDWWQEGLIVLIVVVILWSVLMAAKYHENNR